VAEEEEGGGVDAVHTINAGSARDKG